MNELLNKYVTIKKCVYKGEVYYVRDNGAVMRMPKYENKLRKYDNKWTFGNPNNKTGYMDIAGQTVHRIVAFAFLGNPPTEYHVVDHIDTNRRNNRPENLRWVTRLDNILENPISRARVISICGSIEAFLENPSLLRGHEHIDPNFSWMRTVSKEEASVSLNRLMDWAEERSLTKEGSLGEWVYSKKNSTTYSNTYNVLSNNEIKEEREEFEHVQNNRIKKPLRTQSLTPNAIQLNWKYPVVFPYCPQQFTGNPLESYMANLKKGFLFSTNKYGDSYVLKFGMPQSDCMWVMCSINIGFKTHAFTKITFEEGVFYHENKGVYDIGDEPEKMFRSILKGNMKL